MDRRKSDHYYLGTRLAGVTLVRRCQNLTYYPVQNRADLLGAAPMSMDWNAGAGPRLVLCCSVLYDLTLNEQLAVDYCEDLRDELFAALPEHAWQFWAHYLSTWLGGVIYRDLMTRDEQRYKLSELNGVKGGV